MLEADGWRISKSVLSAVSIEPTGIVSVISAFAHPVCRLEENPFPTVTVIPRANRGAPDITTWSRVNNTNTAASAPQASPSPSNSFAGTWSCPDRGPVVIQQTENRITGSYSWDGRAGQGSGTFEGTANGSQMHVTLQQGGKPIAVVWDMTLSSDGARMDGTWTLNQSQSGGWGCVRGN